jgi:DinB family protein
MTEPNVHEILSKQYRAAMAMLKEAITKYPESLWLAREYPNKSWHIAYHVLFCTHMYLQDSYEQFTPWKKHRENYQWLGRLPSPPHEEPKIGTPYSKEEVLEYLEICWQEIGAKVPGLDFGAPSGFYWLPFNKLELQLYNIRHIQHHAGQLIDRLRTVAGIGIRWVVAV